MIWHFIKTTSFKTFFIKSNFKWLYAFHITYELKVERWAEWGFFHDHNFTLKYHIYNSSAVCFDTQPYWKCYQLIFEGKRGLKLNFELKLTHFYN